jgi:hypothetical protein
VSRPRGPEPEERLVGVSEAEPIAPTRPLELPTGVGNQALARMLESTLVRHPQARCACGGIPGPDGECAECKRRRLEAERAGGGAAVSRTAAPTSERCSCGAPAGPDGLCEQCRAKGAGLLSDEERPARPGAMSRDAFMSQLKQRLSAVCDVELAAVGRSSEGCPYLQTWLAHYESKPAAAVEAAITHYTGERAQDASALMDAVVGRVRGAVRLWATTGAVTGIPAGLDASGPSAGATAGPSAGGASGPSAGGASGPSAGGAAGPSAGGAAVGASASAAPPAALARTPRPLDGTTRSRMERGFGRSFADVRVHTDSLFAARLGVRAVTRGRQVDFSAGEYQPGTLAGDALIAHELAHTVQQRGSDGELARTPQLDTDASLEAEADAAAFGALTGGSARLSERRGLRLQGCSQKAKRCPIGYRWWPTATVQWGSLGCTCIWKCLKAPPSGASSGGAQVKCAPGTVCSDPYDRVAADYTKKGYGAAFTPLTGEPMCGCFPLDLEGEEETDAPLVGVTVDMTNVVGPGADMAAGAKARRRGGGGGPMTDPTTGQRIPDKPPQPPAAVNPLRTRAIQGGMYDSKTAPRLDKVFIEADPAVMTAIERTFDLPHAERPGRIERLLDWAEKRPGVPNRVEEGATFGKGGTGSVAEVVGRPDLASKKGAGRAGSEAAAMVELELAGIQTVYVSEGLNQKGEARLILKRIDGMGSKEIVGRAGKPPEDAAKAAEGRELVTQKTIDDLHAIRDKLKAAKLNVGDFQFIVRRSDGAVFMNDPTGVTPNSTPSGDIDNVIGRFEKIVRDRTRGATSRE